jgi:hypothetical protein
MEGRAWTRSRMMARGLVRRELEDLGGLARRMPNWRVPRSQSCTDDERNRSGLALCCSHEAGQVPVENYVNLRAIHRVRGIGATCHTSPVKGGDDNECGDFSRSIAAVLDCSLGELPEWTAPGRACNSPNYCLRVQGGRMVSSQHRDWTGFGCCLHSSQRQKCSRPRAFAGHCERCRFHVALLPARQYPSLRGDIPRH